MQRHNTLKLISTYLANNDIDNALDCWYDSYAPISPEEFLKCNTTIPVELILAKMEEYEHLCRRS